MVRDPFVAEGTPDLQDVLDALDDGDCRTIVEHLEEPMTAKEISETCDIPLSTTYRKLDLLTEADLVEERTEIRRDGHHTSRYEVAFELVLVALDDDRTLTATLAREPETADQRLANLWASVREET